MNRRLVVRIVTAFLAVAMLAVPASALAGKNGGGKKKDKALVVCKHGCKYRTIQKAVDKAGKTKKKDDVIKVKPGKYVEGVQVLGKKYKGLTIMGTNKNARKTILEGKNAQLPGGVGIANNGIEIADAKDVTIKNMWVRNFATNGVFWHDTNTDDNKATCQNAVAKNVDVSFNRSYGLFMFGCEGGSFNKSEGWGHGDSAYYVGATPFQDDPQKTVLKNLDSYENVLGYSGTNSKYMVIKDSNFYNNGIGLVPNTLDSEPFEPTGVQRDQGQQHLLEQLQLLPAELAGEDRLERARRVWASDPAVPDRDRRRPVRRRRLEGHRTTTSSATSCGASRCSPTRSERGRRRDQPEQPGDRQRDGSRRHRHQRRLRLLDRRLRARGNCFQGNDSSTFAPDQGGQARTARAQLYPACPGPAGTDAGRKRRPATATQIWSAELLDYVLSSSPPRPTSRPDNQECSWNRHSHPPFEDFEPLTVSGFDESGCPA